MTNGLKLPSERVADAIRAVLPNRPDVVLSAQEASDLPAVYRDSLRHYREHARTSIEVGDFRQAAEKTWGAYTQTIKAIAADHGLRVRSHFNILRVSEQLTTLVAHSDPNAGTVLDNGADSAHSMHIHFYENDLPDATVIRRAERVADAIDLLQTLFSDNGNGAGQSQPEATT